ncbi:MAG: hypothetical protein ACRD9S_18330 [Pyrinomonadaceae bacterium]
MTKRTRSVATLVCLLSLVTLGLPMPTQTVLAQSARANSVRTPRPRRDTRRFTRRGDIRRLPPLLKVRLIELAARPNTFDPITAFSEADDPSQLFQFYLLDTLNFQPNVFTATIPGINDGVIPTAANAANGGLPTIGAVRVTLEPKPGLPTDPNDPRAFIDIFMDFSGLFVINNESGWYEGWMISDIRVPRVAPPRPDGTAQFGTITQADFLAIAARGSGNNSVVGNIFTADGNTPRLGSVTDIFPIPERQPNTVPHPVSMGAFNAQQQSDVHAYWEFNRSTNWIFPHYELPFTGGVPGTFAAGLQYNNYTPNLHSIIPGSGPAGVVNDKLIYGDDPDNPRDPDRGLVNEEGPGNPAHLEFRNRFIPSGLDQEVLFNAFVRVASFRPDVTDVGQRLFLSYAQEIARVDQNGDGVISFVEADVDGVSDGLPNTRLYLSPRAFNRFAVTREIDDGLLAPRFAPFQRAYVLSGMLSLVNPSVPASVPRDADDR